MLEGGKTFIAGEQACWITIGVETISVEQFDALVAQLEALEEVELGMKIAIGEGQFAHGAYETVAEARVIAETAWQASETR